MLGCVIGPSMVYVNLKLVFARITNVCLQVGKSGSVSADLQSILKEGLWVVAGAGPGAHVLTSPAPHTHHSPCSRCRNR